MYSSRHRSPSPVGSRFRSSSATHRFRDSSSFLSNSSTVSSTGPLNPFIRRVKDLDVGTSDRYSALRLPPSSSSFGFENRGLARVKYATHEETTSARESQLPRSVPWSPTVGRKSPLDAETVQRPLKYDISDFPSVRTKSERRDYSDLLIRPGKLYTQIPLTFSSYRSASKRVDYSDFIKPVIRNRPVLKTNFTPRSRAEREKTCVPISRERKLIKFREVSGDSSRNINRKLSWAIPDDLGPFSVTDLRDGSKNQESLQDNNIIQSRIRQGENELTRTEFSKASVVDDSSVTFCHCHSSCTESVKLRPTVFSQEHLCDRCIVPARCSVEDHCSEHIGSSSEGIICVGETSGMRQTTAFDETYVKNDSALKIKALEAQTEITFRRRRRRSSPLQPQEVQTLDVDGQTNAGSHHRRRRNRPPEGTDETNAPLLGLEANEETETKCNGSGTVITQFTDRKSKVDRLFQSSVSQNDNQNTSVTCSLPRTKNVPQILLEREVRVSFKLPVPKRKAPKATGHLSTKADESLKTTTTVNNSVSTINVKIHHSTEERKVSENLDKPKGCDVELLENTPAKQAVKMRNRRGSGNTMKEIADFENTLSPGTNGSVSSTDTSKFICSSTTDNIALQRCTTDNKKITVEDFSSVLPNIPLSITGKGNSRCTTKTTDFMSTSGLSVENFTVLGVSILPEIRCSKIGKHEPLTVKNHNDPGESLETSIDKDDADGCDKGIAKRNVSSQKSGIVTQQLNKEFSNKVSLRKPEKKTFDSETPNSPKPESVAQLLSQGISNKINANELGKETSDKKATKLDLNGQITSSAGQNLDTEISEKTPVVGNDREAAKLSSSNQKSSNVLQHLRKGVCNKTSVQETDKIPWGKETAKLTVNSQKCGSKVQPLNSGISNKTSANEIHKQSYDKGALKLNLSNQKSDGIIPSLNREISNTSKISAKELDKETSNLTVSNQKSDNIAQYLKGRISNEKVERGLDKDIYDEVTPKLTINNQKSDSAVKSQDSGISNKISGKDLDKATCDNGTAVKLDIGSKKSNSVASRFNKKISNTISEKDLDKKTTKLNANGQKTVSTTQHLNTEISNKTPVEGAEKGTEKLTVSRQESDSIAQPLNSGISTKTSAKELVQRTCDKRTEKLNLSCQESEGIILPLSKEFSNISKIFAKELDKETCGRRTQKLSMGSQISDSIVQPLNRGISNISKISAKELDKETEEKGTAKQSNQKSDSKTKHFNRENSDKIYEKGLDKETAKLAVSNKKAESIAQYLRNGISHTMTEKNLGKEICDTDSVKLTANIQKCDSVVEPVNSAISNKIFPESAGLSNICEMSGKTLKQKLSDNSQEAESRTLLNKNIDFVLEVSTENNTNISLKENEDTTKGDNTLKTTVESKRTLVEGGTYPDENKWRQFDSSVSGTNEVTEIKLINAREAKEIICTEISRVQSETSEIYDCKLRSNKNILSGKKGLENDITEDKKKSAYNVIPHQAVNTNETIVVRQKTVSISDESKGDSKLVGAEKNNSSTSPKADSIKINILKPESAEGSYADSNAGSPEKDGPNSSVVSAVDHSEIFTRSPMNNVSKHQPVRYIASENCYDTQISVGWKNEDITMSRSQISSEVGIVTESLLLESEHMSSGENVAHTPEMPNYSKKNKTESVLNTSASSNRNSERNDRYPADKNCQEKSSEQRIPVVLFQPKSVTEEDDNILIRKAQKNCVTSNEQKNVSCRDSGDGRSGFNKDINVPCNVKGSNDPLFPELGINISNIVSEFTLKKFASDCDNNFSLNSEGKISDYSVQSFQDKASVLKDEKFQETISSGISSNFVSSINKNEGVVCEKISLTLKGNDFEVSQDNSEILQKSSNKNADTLKTLINSNSCENRTVSSSEVLEQNSTNPEIYLGDDNNILVVSKGHRNACVNFKEAESVDQRSKTLETENINALIFSNRADTRKASAIQQQSVISDSFSSVVETSEKEDTSSEEDSSSEESDDDNDTSDSEERHELNFVPLKNRCFIGLKTQAALNENVVPKNFGAVEIEDTSASDWMSEADDRARSRSQISTCSTHSNSSASLSSPILCSEVSPHPENYPRKSTATQQERSFKLRFRKYTVDDFNFLKLLGKGSFGKVLLAELKDHDMYFAIKCLRKDVVLEDDDVECTMIERRILALGTQHPFICKLYCTFQTESHLFFVMEYLNGGDLMFHIQESGRFDQDRARFYGAEIISALKFLHRRGIVYRDIKLDNIVMDEQGHVRLVDFGMCQCRIYKEEHMPFNFCGTPQYIAPEIVMGQTYNQSVDWWSFGILLYEMLTGRSPFNGTDEDELFWSICNEEPFYPRFLTKEARQLLELLLIKDPSQRLGMPICSAGDVTEQAFFNPINWSRLEKKQIPPPFKPTVGSAQDTRNFDSSFTMNSATVSPVESGILQSMDQTQFRGFSYTNPHIDG